MLHTIKYLFFREGVWSTRPQQCPHAQHRSAYCGRTDLPMSLHFYSTTSCRLSGGGAQARTRKRDPEPLRSKDIGNSHSGNPQSPVKHLTPPQDTTQPPHPAEQPTERTVWSDARLGGLDLDGSDRSAPHNGRSTHPLPLIP